ncbi:MAG: hypothetical protein P1R74_08290 [Sedimenticola sp.]|nr:hypothetical protein [Sedimenticola sp.]
MDGPTGGLLEMICKASSFLAPAGIQLEVDCPETEISIRPDDAVPLALIINELLQNAAKHSDLFDTSLPGIKATLQLQDESVILQISNPSIEPLPSNFNLQQGVGLGTGLTLTRDLLPHRGAKLSMQWEEGRVIAQLTLMSPVISLEERRIDQVFTDPNRLM